VRAPILTPLADEEIAKIEHFAPTGWHSEITYRAVATIRQREAAIQRLVLAVEEVIESEDGGVARHGPGGIRRVSDVPFQRMTEALQEWLRR
jgi:hypothetical protein